MSRKLVIAIEGCCHGELDNIYKQLLDRQKRIKKKIDLLLICGDFQAIRNVTDLACMSCPDKYKQIGGFYRYYMGQRVAPVPTIFVGGNHEAGNHLRELYYGGWVAPNIYYMGGSGVIKFGGLRIGGISGIFKDFDYAKGYYERPPFRGHSRASLHHARAYEAFKMLQIRQPLDIVVSHDWPQYIERHGNTDELVRKKPFFKAEVDRGELGSPVNSMLLERLRPSWWFSAHLHVRFTAQVQSQNSIFGGGWDSISPYDKSEGVAPVSENNKDEIVMALSSDEGSPSEHGLPTRSADQEKCLATNNEPSADHSTQRRPALNLPPPKNDTEALYVHLDEPEQEIEAANATSTIELAEVDVEFKDDHQKAEEASDSIKTQTLIATDPRIPGRSTNFLALDKCLPRRQFLEIVEIETEANISNRQLRIEYDPEWLAILRLCNEHMPLDESPFHPPAAAVMTDTTPRLPLFPDELVSRELRWVSENVFSGGRVAVPLNFAPIAPAPPPDTPDHVSFGLARDRGGGRGGGGGRGRGGGGHGHDRGRGGGSHGQHRGQRADAPWPGPRPDVIYPNTQTEVFCKMIGIQDHLTQRRH